jgi:hypothetical protein
MLFLIIAGIVIVFVAVLWGIGAIEDIKIHREFKKKYGLKYKDYQCIKDNNFLDKDSFCNSSSFLFDISFLYAATIQELLSQKKLVVKKDFLDSLFDTCEWFVLEKHGFVSDKIKIPDEEDDAVKIVKTKLTDIKPFTEKEKQKLFHENPDFALLKYQWLINNFDSGKPEMFYQEISELGTYLSRHDTMGRKIFIQAHKFLAKHNVAYSLMCYLQYLNVKTSASNFHHRTITKELRSQLFRNKQQETRFLDICDQLKEDKILDKALESVRLLFRISRRKIELDMPEIEEAFREQAETAKLLGKYLEDEIETDTDKSFFTPDALPLEHKNELFKLFKLNNFVLNKKEINIFAQKEGIFYDNLIRQINETYYDEFDDLMIEEDAGIYTLNSNYLEKIRK